MKRIEPSNRKNHYGLYQDEDCTQLVLQDSGSDPSIVLKTLVETNYKRVRMIVLDRDRWRCVRCGRKSNLEVHHKVHRSDVIRGRDDRPENLETLCGIGGCHDKEHRGANARSRRHSL